jgi:hypothetical protein
MRIVFVGNFHVDFSSETHHKKSLESLGHQVIALQEGEASGEQILMVSCSQASNSGLTMVLYLALPR